MKKNVIRLIALAVCLCTLLSGCGVVDIWGYFEQFRDLMYAPKLTAFADMEYVRPDMDEFDRRLEHALDAAEWETEDIYQLEQAILDFYEIYDRISTSYALANIYYSQDLTDSKWEEEYNYCSSLTATVDAGLDKLYRALAKSPLRDELEGDEYFGEGFFDNYEGESLYDETFQAMLEKEAELQSRYYAISGEAAAAEYYSEEYFSVYGKQMADVFVEMIRLRQQIAAYAGYNSYPEFAYDFYFGRDYTVREAKSYLSAIQADLVPLFTELLYDGKLDVDYGRSSQKQTAEYVREMASAMGGIVDQAFQAMEEGDLYDISSGKNKFEASFEVYLSSYNTPFVFMNPTNTDRDKLTFAHEFGHFCSDYASVGNGAGVDVAEVFSQGMEYLSLCYVEDEDLAKLKMSDCLQVYILQAAYASFEMQVYDLEDSQLTAENVEAVYARVLQDYGLGDLGWDTRDYVGIMHFFVSPMYVISYVVSNDVALQLYQLEAEEDGKGLACLTENLTSSETGIVTFAEAAGLESPFRQDRLKDVAKTLEKVLK